VIWSTGWTSTDLSKLYTGIWKGWASAELAGRKRWHWGSDGTLVQGL